MLLITTKRNVILRSKCVNTWKFLHSLQKVFKVITILQSKIIFYSAITQLILKIPQFSLPTVTTLKLVNEESELINRDHAPLNKNKLPYLFDS